MRVTIVDRLVSSLTYFTFGLAGVIWLVYVNVAKKHMGEFVIYNIYQSIFISLLFAVIGYFYGLITKLITAIPIIGPIIQKINLFLYETPMYFGYSLIGLILTCIILYLIIASIIGKKPYLPVVSDIIKANVGA